MKKSQGIGRFVGILLGIVLADCALEKCQAEIQGGDQWKQQFEQPTTVRVEFEATLNCVGVAGVSLAGVATTVTNDFDEACGFTWLNTDPGYAQLRPYQTYVIYLWGTNMYGASLTGVSVPSPSPKLGSGGDTGAPQQRYRAYIWSTNTYSYNFNPATQSWESQSVTNWAPLCSGNMPGWNCESDNNGNCCVGMSKGWYIQIRPDGILDTSKAGEPGAENMEDSNPWDGDQMPMDAPVAPGDGEVVTMAAGNSSDPSAINLSWNVSLGRLWNGSSVGKLRLLADRLDTNTYTPLCLHFASRSSDTNEVAVRVSLTNSAYLGQIKTPQTLMNVDVPSSNSFALKFYLTSMVTGQDTNGFYTLTNTATPFVIWQVDSSDGTTNNWRLREVRSGGTNTTTLAFNSSSRVWTLTRGTGNEARVETRAVTTNVVSGVTNRIEVVEVKNGAGVVSDRTAEGYQQFAWGFTLVTVTNDPGGANLVTTFTRGTDTNAFDYGQLTFVQYPDRFWEQRIYADEDTWLNEGIPPGALWRIINPWKDSPTNSDINDCLVTQMYYYPGSQTYSVRKWHTFTNDPSYDIVSTVYGELNWFSEDDCGSNFTVTQGRRTGEISSSAGPGGFQDDQTSFFGPYYGHLSGQTYERWNEIGIDDAYDYQFGQWNAASNTFTLNGATNDLRQIIYHGTRSGGDDILTTGESGIDVADISLTPFQSTKEVKIIDDGNLAAHETYLYTGQLTNFVLIDQVIYQRDSLGHATNVFRIDPATHQARTTYKANWQGTNTWLGDLKFSDTDETGTTNLYTYDSLKRLKTKTKQGVSASGYPAQGDIVQSLSYDAAGRVLTNTVNGGSLNLRTISSFDLSGRLTALTTPDTLTTTYAYVDGGLQTNITYSSGATQILRNYLDRRVASITGTAVTNQFFEYSFNDWRVDPGVVWASGDAFGFVPQNVTKVQLGATNALRWTSQITDRRFVPVEERRPGFHSTNDLSTLTQRISNRLFDGTYEAGFEDQDGNLAYISTRFKHDFYGLLSLQSLFVDPIQWWDNPASVNRMSSNTWNYATNASGHWFKVSQQYGFLTDNSSASNLLQTVKQRVTGFASNEVSETLTYDANNNLTDVKVNVDLANNKVIKVTDTPESTLSATNVAVNGLLQTESTATVSAVAWHYYDALGRETSMKDPLGFTTSTTYDSTTGRVTARTDRFGQTTTYSYYAAGGPNAGMLYCETGPTGKKTYYKYNDRGQLIQKWGDVPYPEQRLYSQFGEMTNLITYRSGSGWTGSAWPTNTTGTGDVTKWFYDEPTGLLTNRTDAASQSVNYSYYNNWMLKTRTWARNVASTNIYNDVRDLMEIDYSDGTTSLIYTNQDRRGLPRTVIDATGTRALSYDVFGRVLNDGWSAGTFNGLSVSNHFHQYYGRDLLKFSGSPTTIQHDYSYDSYGRMGSAAYGVYSANYAYLANSDLLQTTTDKNNGSTVLTTSRSWEYGARLGVIANTTSSATVNAYAYAYDALQRRTRATWSDGSAWAYDYNDRNELISAKRYWADFNPVFGQHYEYAFDNIGNRTTNRFGGDANGANLRPFAYTANNLNQYTSRTVPGYLETCGAAQATATSVTVNGSAADNRKVEYFAKELSVANGSGPVWQDVTAIATLGSNSTTNSGNTLVPPATQNFSYDADGNLTNDTVWVYMWDAENRLTQVTNLTTVGTNARKKVVFTYDHLGRRSTKKVYLWASSDYSTSPVADERFVYDGWNLIAELNATNNAPIRSYLWGKDLSGSINGAGGIGGLVMVTDHGASAYHFTAYEGNGNVTALVKADGTTSANYEYDPFGQTIRITGALAKANPFRFSTKFTDDETDLVYYGYRYYHPNLGRWINRDPISEQGGINLYSFLANQTVDKIDPFGKLFLDLLLGSAIDLGLEYTDAAVKLKQGLTIKEMAKALRRYSDFRQGMIMAATLVDLLDYAELAAEVKEAVKKLAKGLRGFGDLHHIFANAKEFEKAFKNAGINKDGATVGLPYWIHEMLHGNNGGAWNELWRTFFANAGEMAKNPFYVLGFGFGLVKEFGLGNLPVGPY